jgi:hypothetical protein
MNLMLSLPKFLIAGGAFLGTLQLPQQVPVDNHTLLGERIPSAQVVTRSRWGTPMLPDGKGGYSLIAPINQKNIAQSLWIPPVSGHRPVVEKPAVVTSQPNASGTAAPSPKDAATDPVPSLGLPASK